MAVEAAERLLAEHAPPGWTDMREAAYWSEHLNEDSTDDNSERVPWIALSTGEQALIRLALSLWGAPGVTCSLYRDLGALDRKHQRAVLDAISEALVA